MKKLLVFLGFILLAGAAFAQPVQTVTVAQNQSLSPVINLAGGQVGLKTPVSGLVIIPPAALEASSYELILYACADAAGANCMSMADSGANLIKYRIVGGATPTSAMVIDPSVVAGLWWFKIQIAGSNDAGISQTTASRTFTILARPLQ